MLRNSNDFNDVKMPHACMCYSPPGPFATVYLHITILLPQFAHNSSSYALVVALTLIEAKKGGNLNSQPPGTEKRSKHIGTKLL